MPTDIRALVDDFTSKLEQMIRRTALEQVVQALGGGASPAPRRGPGRPRKTAGTVPIRRAPKGAKRSSESLDQMKTKLLAHVKAHPGQRGEQIAAALKTDVGTMRLPMKKLIEARAVRTEGQRRGMMYYASAGGVGPAKSTGDRGGKKTGAKRGKRGRQAAEAKAEAPVAVAA